MDSCMDHCKEPSNKSSLFYFQNCTQLLFFHILIFQLLFFIYAKIKKMHQYFMFQQSFFLKVYTNHPNSINIIGTLFEKPVKVHPFFKDAQNSPVITELPADTKMTDLTS